MSGGLAEYTSQVSFGKHAPIYCLLAALNDENRAFAKLIFVAEGSCAASDLRHHLEVVVVWGPQAEAGHPVEAAKEAVAEATTEAADAATGRRRPRALVQAPSNRSEARQTHLHVLMNAAEARWEYFFWIHVLWQLRGGRCA